MNTYNNLINNLEELELLRFKENIDTYLDIYCVYFITFQDLISQLKKAALENRLETRIKWFCRYKLLIIDELGYQKMDVDSANLFFNLIAKRYEKLSTVITTNSPFSKWSDIFQEPVLTNALLDRLLHHCSVININEPSYRLKDQMQYIIEENLNTRNII